MEEWCIIVQGPSDSVSEIKRSTEGYKTIFSTWVGDESKYSKDDDVIFNEKPKEVGIGNLYYQQTSTMNGLLKAQNLGFKNVFKTRSDFIPTNINELIKGFTHKLNLFFWHNYTGGYICDYFMAGEIELMIKLWKKKSDEGYNFAERMITENFFEMGLKEEDFRILFEQTQQKK